MVSQSFLKRAREALELGVETPLSLGDEEPFLRMSASADYHGPSHQAVDVEVP